MLYAETSPLDEPFAIEPASEEEIAMIEEGMAPLAGKYEGDPPSFKDWKTIKKELGLAALPRFRYAFGMETAKLFQIGQSQAVRLPKEFRFSGEEENFER